MVNGRLGRRDRPLRRAQTPPRRMEPVRYVSARVDAPPLGLVDVTLAGLARDGGLYVPETWPRLDRETIAGFAGRPYAEVTVEVMRAFAGGAVADADLARMAREAYGAFRHPAVTPLKQIGASTFILELFHGPTLAFKDLAMQFLARLIDHALASRGERATIAVATSGDTGGAAVEAFRGRSQVDLAVLFPDGRISDVQRRMMTCAEDANVHALAIEGTFDDCQAIVKAMFNHHAFRDRVALAGVNSINFARIAAQVVYYFVAAGRSARRIARSLSRCRPAILATSSPAMWRPRWDCPSTGSRSRPTSTTSWCARSRPASTRSATWSRPPRPRWTSRCPLISNACCSRRTAATRNRCAPPWPRWRSRGASRSRRRRSPR